MRKVIYVAMGLLFLEGGARFVQGATGSGTNIPPVTTNALVGTSLVDYLSAQLPAVGDHALHVLSPTILELKLITTKPPDPAPVSQWDFVDSNFQLTLPF